MTNELRKNVDPAILRGEASRLSEEIADLTEIFSEEQMSTRSREKMAERIRNLGEKRNQIHVALTS